MLKKFMYYSIYAASIAVIPFFYLVPLAAGQQSGRFFLMGSGNLHLNNLRNAQEAKVRLLNGDGSLNEKAFDEVDRVFDFPTNEKGEHISPRLLFMLSYFADRLAPGKTINIESAYRSPEYNNKIREKGANAAKTSIHMDGMALDFWLEGVEGKNLWETIREKNCCGVGHYGGKTIHLDAGRPRFWEAATSGTRSKEPDNNRHLYLSTDFDRYRLQERMRLSLSAISTFGFGVKPMASLFSPADAEKPVAQMRIATNNTSDTSDCLLISDHKASRFLYAALPPQVVAGRYTVKIEFCNKPFAEMPSALVSNEIEVSREAKTIQ